MIGVGDGTIRKSVGEFLYALHSNFSSISASFRDIAPFVLQHTIFPHPMILPLVSPNFPMFPWVWVDGIWATNRVVGLTVRAISFQAF